MRALAPLALILAASAAGAKPGTPGPDYFVGSYAVVGQTAARALISTGAEVMKDGQGLILRRCNAPDITLSFGPAFEIVNLMTGAQDGDVTECLFHNNGYNRPILTCRSKGGAAYTLWPTDIAAPICP